MYNKFIFCDIHWSCTSYSTHWSRVKKDDASKILLKKGDKFNLFHTIQSFDSRFHKDDESHYCPLFFDFDSAVLSDALTDANKVKRFFYSLGIPHEHLRIWFSGSKGFHITVTPELFNLKPSNILTYQIKECALYLINELDLKTLDLNIYSKRRMWRLPGSVNLKSGKRVVELYPDEADDINNISLRSEYKNLYDDSEYKDVHAIENAENWFNWFVDEYRNKTDITNLKPKIIITKPKDIDCPVCIKYINERDPFPNMRNRTEMALASFYKDIGVSKEEALIKVNGWISNIKKDSEKISSRLNDTKHVVNNLFKDDNNHFSCAFIRSLAEGSADIVPCEYNDCKFVKKQSDQISDDLISVSLNESVRAMYANRNMKIPIMISGKSDSPYQIPSKIRVSCVPNDRSNSKCFACSLFRIQKNGVTDIDLSKFSDKALELVDIPSKLIDKQIAMMIGIPKNCGVYLFDNTEMQNVLEVTMMPTIEYVSASGDYTIKNGFFFGYDIKSNSEYDIESKCVPFPKTQSTVLLFDKATPKSSSISEFKLTQQIRNALLVFRCKGNNIADKFTDIHDHLERNVTHIWGRRDVAIAIDLIYHTCSSFYFQGEHFRRGWGNLLIIGDSGQAKTQLAQKIRDFYNLGTIVSGESSSRTGLVYSLVQGRDRWGLHWGVIPLNDRRLVVIDEFNGVSQDDIEVMSRMRETGVVEVSRVVNAKTLARTRLIFLSNTKTGKMLKDYQYSVKSIPEIFTKSEDIRRLDLAIAVRSGDIDFKTINTKIGDVETVEDKYYHGLCEQLLLWAWSRADNQIKFTDDAVNMILESANTLSSDYVSDIPLIEPADIRVKLCRLSIACAARLFSTDDTFENILVKACHVEFVVNFLDRIYKSDAMGYHRFSSNINESRFMNPELRESIKEKLKTFNEYAVLVKLLIRTDYIRKTNLKDMWGVDNDRMNIFWAWAARNHLIIERRTYYAKSDIFISILKEIEEELSGGDIVNFSLEQPKDIPF